MRPKLSMLGLLFSRIVFYKPVSFAYYAIPISLLMMVYGAIEYLNRSDEYQYATEAVLFLLLFVYLAYIFRAFYLVGGKGIVQAPIWVTNLVSGDNAQLQVQGSDSKDRSGKRMHEIVLTVFQGRCSVCGSVVEVGNGPGQYRGRLIGKCQRNPVEHIYSFDYVTRKGVPLRKDTYLG